MIDAETTRDTHEYHFWCEMGHEFSVMLKAGDIVEKYIICVVGACTGLAETSSTQSHQYSSDSLEN